MSRTPRQPSPRTAKPRVDSTTTPAECKCHFRNSGFRCVTNRRLTKVIALEEASEESPDLEFAVGEAQTPQTCRERSHRLLQEFFRANRKLFRRIYKQRIYKQREVQKRSRTGYRRYARLRRAQELRFGSTVLGLSTKACAQASCGPGQMSD